MSPAGRLSGLFMFVGCACAHGEVPRQLARSSPSPKPTPSPTEPWWAGIETGVYRFEDHRYDGVWRLAAARSTRHHHFAEGLLDAKVMARLDLEHHFAQLGPLEVLDIRFVASPATLVQTIYVLYGERIANDHSATVLNPPQELHVGRHKFEAGRHLFRECVIEGPFTNPEWGSSSLTASLAKPTHGGNHAH